MIDDTDDEWADTSGEIKNKGQEIKVEDIDIAIRMLTTHMNADDISGLIEALTTLKSDPQNEDLQLQVVIQFEGLGILQGAVLTYAPYMNIFVSSDPFGDS